MSIVDRAALDGIPGTTVFTAERARQGYRLNQFCMSLMKADNRDRFKADERAYMTGMRVPEAAQDAVIARDFNAMIAQGGNIYFLAKIFATDGRSFQWAAARMTGMAQEDYAAMMLAGGRSPAGQQSTREES